MQLKSYLILMLMVLSGISTAIASSDSTLTPPIEKKVGDLLIQSFPEDTLFRFIKKYGRDSLAKQLDGRINSAIEFLRYRSFMLENSINTLQLKMVNRHFKLNLDSQLVFLDTTSSPVYFRLYGSYYSNSSVAKDVKDVADNFSRREVDSLMMTYANDRFIRNILISYCHHLPWKVELFAYFNALSKISTQYRNECYWQFSEFASNKCTCDDQKYFDSSLALLKKSITDIVYYKDTTYLLDHTNYIEPLKSLTYALYAKDLSLSNGAPIALLLSKQLKDGGWSKNLMDTEDSQVISTFFGLWALCEVRDRVRDYK